MNGIRFVVPMAMAGVMLPLTPGCGRSEALAGGPADPPSARVGARPAPKELAVRRGTPAAQAPVATAPVPAPKSPAAVETHYARPSKGELRSRLTPEQYSVTEEDGTEPPFHNEYWNNHEPGIYVDVTTGEPLFSSADKFESGTGWPSFTRPIAKAHIVEHTDTTLGMSRTEVRSSGGDAHLGHVFDDGPAPTGLRYCINSAALRFIPASKLAAEGYGQYARLFPAAK